MTLSGGLRAWKHAQETIALSLVWMKSLASALFIFFGASHGLRSSRLMEVTMKRDALILIRDIFKWKETQGDCKVN